MQTAFQAPWHSEQEQLIKPEALTDQHQTLDEMCHLSLMLHAPHVEPNGIQNYANHIVILDMFTVVCMNQLRH